MNNKERLIAKLEEIKGGIDVIISQLEDVEVTNVNFGESYIARQNAPEILTGVDTLEYKPSDRFSIDLKFNLAIYCKVSHE